MRTGIDDTSCRLGVAMIVDSSPQRQQKRWRGVSTALARGSENARIGVELDRVWGDARLAVEEVEQGDAAIS
jgi:hypothetical protein